MTVTLVELMTWKFSVQTTSGQISYFILPVISSACPASLMGDRYASWKSINILMHLPQHTFQNEGKIAYNTSSPANASQQACL